MKDVQQQFLTLRQFPARLTAEQTAWLLNCQLHDMPVLVSTRLLKPLGSPAQNGTKFFHTAEVLELTKDRSWLAKITGVIANHWQRKNAAKKSSPVFGLEH